MATGHGSTTITNFDDDGNWGKLPQQVIKFFPHVASTRTGSRKVSELICSNGTNLFEFIKQDTFAQTIQLCSNGSALFKRYTFIRFCNSDGTKNDFLTFFSFSRCWSPLSISMSYVSRGTHYHPS